MRKGVQGMNLVLWLFLAVIMAYILITFATKFVFTPYASAA